MLHEWGREGCWEGRGGREATFCPQHAGESY